MGTQTDIDGRDCNLHYRVSVRVPASACRLTVSSMTGFTISISIGTKAAGWAGMVMLIFFFFGFAFGMLPMSWLYPSEILPLHMRHVRRASGSFEKLADLLIDWPRCRRDHCKFNTLFNHGGWTSWLLVR
jgi:hypothetical protein